MGINLFSVNFFACSLAQTGGAGERQAAPASKGLVRAKESWAKYCQEMIGPDGFPLMYPGERTTTSEAASYALLQAAMLGDFSTFDRVWDWTEKNLQRTDDLFKWKISNGKSSATEQDPASDADQDIAAALIIAWVKTGREIYKQKAQQILRAIWRFEVAELDGGRLIMTAGRQQKYALGKGMVGINPSYFRPTWYEALFPLVLPEHNWQGLIATSYEFTEKAADTRSLHGPALGRPNLNAVVILGTKNLPPEFFAVTKQGEIKDHPWRETQDFIFAGDSWRTLYWFSLQRSFNPSDQQARRFLTEQTGTGRDAGPLRFLKDELAQGMLRSGYQINGEPAYDLKGFAAGKKWPYQESLWTYAIAQAYFQSAGERTAADQVQKIIDQKYGYRATSRDWPVDDQYDRGAYYYGQTWMRFSLLLSSLDARKLLFEYRGE